MLKIAVFYNQTKPQSTKTAAEILAWCATHQIKTVTCCYESKDKENDDRGDTHATQIAAAQVDLIVVVGGDGTLLRAARLFAKLKLPLLPVSAGRVSFMMHLKPANVCAALQHFKTTQTIAVDSRLMLDAIIQKRPGNLSALNEIVITSVRRARLTSIEMLVDGEPLKTFSTDGLIIATSTGSTAYSLSAGGPLVHPKLDSIIITPVCPHSLFNRSMVLPSTAKITIKTGIKSERLMVIADGQFTEDLEAHEVLDIQAAKVKLRLASTKFDDDFYTQIKSKLNFLN